METVLVGPTPRIAVTYAGKGPVLLFLHGIRGNKRNWYAQLEAFSANFTAAAWDARGYGESDDYAGPLQFDDFASDVVRVADHFDAQRIHLAGLSMGGRIARNVALRFPERLHSLTLVATAPGFQRGRTPLPPEKLLGQLCSDLTCTSVDEIILRGLHQYFDELQTKMNQVATHISETFFAARLAVPIRRKPREQKQSMAASSGFVIRDS